MNSFHVVNNSQAAGVNSLLAPSSPQVAWGGSNSKIAMNKSKTKLSGSNFRQMPYTNSNVVNNQNKTKSVLGTFSSNNEEMSGNPSEQMSKTNVKNSPNNNASNPNDIKYTQQPNQSTSVGATTKTKADSIKPGETVEKKAVQNRSRTEA